MTRAEHLEWAKERAIELCEKGEILGAYLSFQSDMAKHEETAHHIALDLMGKLLLHGHLSSAEAMREFIEGFN